MVKELTESYKADIVDATPDANLVLFCPALHGLGASLLDRSVYANHGSISGATWKRLASGLWVLSFDGVSACVNFGSDASLDNLTELTYELWILPQQNAAEILYDKLGIKYLYLEVNRRLSAVIAGATGVGSTSTNVVTNNIWNKVSLTFSSSGDKKIYLYLNGAGCTYAIQGTAVLPLTSDATGNLGLAARLPPKTYPYKGYIGMPRVYSRALTSTEILQHYNREKHLFKV